MSKRIYVGGLPYATTADQLEALFKPYGQVVDSIIVTDKVTGQARGFAFVEMKNDGEADAAIAALNGSEYGGRRLVVNVARERERPPRRSSYER